MKILFFLIAILQHCFTVKAQDYHLINRIWTLNGFEPVKKGGLTLMGFDGFRCIDLTSNEQILLKGIPDKIDTANYKIENDQIIILDKMRKNIEGANTEIKIDKLKRRKLVLLFLVSGKDVFRLSYTSE